VLVDVERYLIRHPHAVPRHFPNGLDYFNAKTMIPTALLEEVVAEQGVSFCDGDVLVVRTGFVKKWLDLCKRTNMEEYNEWLRTRKGNIGVCHTEDILKWHWENGIAAVVCDR
jgi:kynurenine formamidase